MARILVIDDEESICRLFREILEHEGYEVETAVNGKSGVEAYRRKPADLIITDILMPEKDGLELIIELRRANRAVRIIAMTGGSRYHSLDNFLDVAKAFGASHTLYKPFRNEKVVEIVRKVLEDAPG